MGVESLELYRNTKTKVWWDSEIFFAHTYLVFFLEDDMKIFVACSGEESVDIKYRDLATDVATLLVRKQHKLLFGGLDTGAMHKCYMTYKYEGGKVKAIADVHDATVVNSLEVDAYEITPTTFEQIKRLYDQADLVLVLPGGINTLAEFFSILNEKKKKWSDKPIILFNYHNYYRGLLKFLEGVYNEGFATSSDMKLFGIVSDIQALESYLDNLEMER